MCIEPKTSKLLRCSLNIIILSIYHCCGLLFDRIKFYLFFFFESNFISYLASAGVTKKL